MRRIDSPGGESASCENGPKAYHEMGLAARNQQQVTEAPCGQLTGNTVVAPGIGEAVDWTLGQRDLVVGERSPKVRLGRAIMDRLEKSSRNGAEMRSMGLEDRG